MAKKYTIFQSLDKALSGNWSAEDGRTHINSYDMSNASNVIYKTKNKEDYERTKLELQQNEYLKERWIKANVDLSVSAFSGLNNLKLMYRDADLMDSFPEIGAALDILSEESVLAGPNGMVVNVASDSNRIKSILEDLFVNRLNMQIMAQMVIRAMCKYGNQFMLLDIDNKLGVKGWKQLPVFNVERLENGITNPYGSGLSLAVNNVGQEDLTTKFVWLDESNSQVPFRDWQVAHFRLLNNSMYLPYGCLVGDTRIETEFGYKEMSDIEIGDKVWTFNIDTQERELGSVTMFMPKGKKEVYRVLTKHNFIEGTKDHKLLVYKDGEFLYKEIKDLKIDDLLIIRNGIKNSNQTHLINKKELVPPKNVAKQKFEIETNSFNFQIDDEIAEFFGYMIGDGSITYGRIITIAGSIQETFNKKYEAILKKLTKSRVKRVYRNNGTLLKITTCSKFLCEVLYKMGYIDGFSNKRIPNWVYESNESIRKSFLRGLINADGYIIIDNRRSNSSIRCDIELENENLIKDIKILVQSLGYKSGQIFSRFRKPHFSEKIGRLLKYTNPSHSLSYYEVQNSQEKCNEILNRLKDGFKVEKIRKIEYVGEKETYDFTVDNNNSNFFANGIVTHNCSSLNSARRSWRMLSLMEDMMLIYRLERSIERRVYKIYVGAIDDADVQAYVENIANNFKRTPIIDPMTGQVDLRKNILSVSDDIFIPVRDPNAPTPIDTLSAAQNLTAMDDIKYVQNKVLTALRIPKPFLNFEESAGEGKNLSLLDIRFTRTVNRIQQAFLMELTKIATIHLYILGFTDDLTNFTLTMNNPSTLAEQIEIENIQKKVSTARDAVSDPGNGIPIMSQTRALKEIMKWSEKEIKDNLEEIRLEKALSAELEKTTQIINRTGIFDTVDRIYGEPGAEYQDGQGGGQGEEGGPGGPMGGGPMGGGDFGGGLDDLGAPGMGDMGDIPGAEGEEPTGEMGEPGMESPGGPGGTGSNEGPGGPPMESYRFNKPLINEMFDHYLKKVSKNNEAVNERVDIIDKAFIINEEINEMIKGLDDIKL